MDNYLQMHITYKTLHNEIHSSLRCWYLFCRFFHVLKLNYQQQIQELLSSSTRSQTFFKTLLQ